MPKKPQRSRKGPPDSTSGPDDGDADLVRPEEGDPIHFESSARRPSWSTSWGGFVEQNRSWYDRVCGDGPVYALPIDVIEGLAEGTKSSDSGHRALEPFISGEDAESEHRFLRFCRDFQSTTVGVAYGRPVAYQLLTERGWTGSISSAETDGNLLKILDQLQGIHHQLLGYVGRLTFDEQYRRDKAILEARWSSLPDRPLLPLNGNVADQPAIPIVSIERHRDRVLGEEVERFLLDFGRFMRTWRLNQMITWDLPLPQGPLDPAPLGLQVTVLGPDHLATTIPSFYDVPSGVDVRGIIREQQGQAAKADGVEMEHPVTDASSRAGRASQYESAFRLWLIESTVRRRYGSPRGLVARLKPAFASFMGVSEDRVHQLRQLYSVALDAEG